jgi:hypothetical protein
MENPLDQIPELIEQGKKFTFQNFSSKTDGGYVRAYSDDWLVWTHHTNAVVQKIGSSPISSSIARGLGMELIGEDENDFARARDLILNGLQAALRVFSAIPASNRIVTLGHNSPAQNEAIETVDNLIEAVRTSNDFEATEDERALAIAELSAGRRLLESARARVAAVRETLQPTLKWILEKGAGAIVGKIAGRLWDILTNLHFF